MLLTGVTITTTSTDTKLAAMPTPQMALRRAEDLCAGLKKRSKATEDELREIVNACLAHEGTSLALLTMRWENFKRTAPADILEIGKVFGFEKNGCGPAGWRGALVPDRPITLLWLVSFEKACNLHDILYGIGGDWIAKLFADLYFRRKMEDACRHKLLFTWALGLRWGERTAEIYFYSVSKYGDSFFKFNKQKKEVIV
jgi:hypothetical protein